MLTKVWYTPSNHPQPGIPVIRYNKAWYKHTNRGHYPKPKSFSRYDDRPDTPPVWNGTEGYSPLSASHIGSTSHLQQKQLSPYAPPNQPSSSSGASSSSANYTPSNTAAQSFTPAGFNPSNSPSYSSDSQMAGGASSSHFGGSNPSSSSLLHEMEELRRTVGRLQSENALLISEKNSIYDLALRLQQEAQLMLQVIQKHHLESEVTLLVMQSQGSLNSLLLPNASSPKHPNTFNQSSSPVAPQHSSSMPQNAYSSMPQGNVSYNNNNNNNNNDQRSIPFSHASSQTFSQYPPSRPNAQASPMNAHSSQNNFATPNSSAPTTSYNPPGSNSNPSTSLHFQASPAYSNPNAAVNPHYSTHNSSSTGSIHSEVPSAGSSAGSSSSSSQYSQNFGPPNNSSQQPPQNGQNPHYDGGPSPFPSHLPDINPHSHIPSGNSHTNLSSMPSNPSTLRLPSPPRR